MASTHKKVIVRKFDRDTMQGHVAPAFLVDGKLELLNLAGKVVSVDLADVKGVYFVRDFGDTEDLIRKTFTTRPRTEGLWVRLSFRDNDVVEGMMPNDLTQNPPEGYFVNPPDARSNTQRIFVPKSALHDITVLAVIGAPGTRRRKPATRPPDSRQVPMFSE
ncbi:MAG TPA: hypothetical protein VKW78_05870 [Terriglobales bacterium]|nr:hypothetical protein [Terriglobales bacterium]